MKNEQFILVSVPLEMFLEAGINTESIIQVSAREGKIIIDTPDSTEDYVCDRDCENCPLNAMPCEFDVRIELAQVPTLLPLRGQLRWEE